MRALRRRLARRAGAEAGFTLIELLIASTLFLLVLGATLDTYGVMESRARTNGLQQDSQQMARQTIVVLSRDLRNLAGPDEGQPEAFDTATPYDVVFKTVDPNGPNAGQNPTNVRRVRYCLDAGTPAKLWMQTQTWTSATPPAAPSTTSCPDPSWASQRMVANAINNRYSGQDRAVFLFDSATTTAITTVRVNLWVNVNPGKAPGETQLQSGVFLRNQDQTPTASFQWTQGGSGHVVLNASASSDPEGQQLSYTWKEGSTKIGSSVTLDWGPVSAGVHSVTLEVRNPAGLLGTSTVAVAVPS
jgi:prepilin-type N-terminal cleavage/methylation domain-containing protein